MAQSTQARSGGADWALQPPNPAVVRHWQQHLLPAMLVVEQRVLAYAIVATPPSVSASTGSHCDPVCEEASSPGDEAGENQASSSSTTAPCAAAAPISHWPRGCWRYRIAGAPIAVDLAGVCCWDDVLARALHMAAAITAAFAPPSPAALPLRQQNQPALRRPRQLVLHLALRGHLLSPSDYLRPSLRWSWRVQKLVYESIQLQNIANWISTLGGAHSQLGDGSVAHARQAEQMAYAQFRVARRLGDDALAARCRLYVALGAVQQGHFARARSILKGQYALALRLNDRKLQSMCRAIARRLEQSRPPR